jgi:hypothetical protein
MLSSTNDQESCYIRITTKMQTGEKSSLRLRQSAVFWYNLLRDKKILGKCTIQDRHQTFSKYSG